MRRVIRMPILFYVLMLVFNLSGLALTQERYPHLPDSRLTPGEAVDVTADDLCKPGAVDLEDRVPVALKRQVFDTYGIAPSEMGYNVDHLIPVSLGGSNSIKNLWPQPLSGKWTHRMKNRLERRMREIVCSGELELKHAQREIAADWVSAYKKYIGNP